MSHLYVNKSKISKKPKINFFSSSLWRSMYLVNLNDVYHSSEKKIPAKGSVIPLSYKGYEALVYNGRSWQRKYINRWVCGHKFGEFTWNRKIAVYKAKQMRKKSKKK